MHIYTCETESVNLMLANNINYNENNRNNDAHAHTHIPHTLNNHHNNNYNNNSDITIFIWWSGHSLLMNDRETGSMYILIYLSNLPWY